MIALCFQRPLSGFWGDFLPPRSMQSKIAQLTPDLAVFLPSSIFDDISDLAGNIYTFSIQNQRSDPENISERLQAILSPVFTPENGLCYREFSTISSTNFRQNFIVEKTFFTRPLQNLDTKRASKIFENQAIFIFIVD